MMTYEFTLVLAGLDELTAELEDRLFEAGCDDAILGIRDQTAYLDFDRESGSATEAVLTAIEDAEGAAEGLEVRRVEPDDLVSAAEIGSRTGRSRESIRLLVTGQRGPGGFPRPVSGLKRRSRLWRWSEVADWLSTHGLADNTAALELARAIAAVNGALDLRRSREVPGRDLLDRLVG